MEGGTLSRFLQLEREEPTRPPKRSSSSDADTPSSMPVPDASRAKTMTTHEVLDTEPQQPHINTEAHEEDGEAAKLARETERAERVGARLVRSSGEDRLELSSNSLSEDLCGNRLDRDGLQGFTPEELHDLRDHLIDGRRFDRDGPRLVRRSRVARSAHLRIAGPFRDDCVLQ